MATGSLVFVDEMSTPMPDAPVDGEHVVVYDNNDQDGKLWFWCARQPVASLTFDSAQLTPLSKLSAFLAKLKFYLDHPEEMRRVALNGFLHSLRHHRAVTRVDWIIRSALEAKGDPTPFTDTGEAIKNKGSLASLRISHGQPGAHR